MSVPTMIPPRRRMFDSILRGIPSERYRDMRFFDTWYWLWPDFVTLSEAYTRPNAMHDEMFRGFMEMLGD